MPSALQLAFFAVTEEPQGACGGWLATNRWGRPLEFRLTSCVQPSRVQQILFGKGLAAYLHGEVLGKALSEKASTQPQVIVVAAEPALELRRHVSVPVAWLRPAELAASEAEGLVKVGPHELLPHAEFPEDRAALHELAPELAGLDLEEPFARVRDALAEARKMGAAARAA